MNNVKYSLDVLKKVDEFDAASAVKNFISPQEYFDRLTDFTKDWPNYLHSYNPTVVIYSDGVRDEFLTEVEEIKRVIMPLEMKSAISRLENLEVALSDNKEKALVDGLRVFYAALEIAAGYIASALLTGDGNSSSTALENVEKPVILAVDDKPELLATITNVLKDEYRVIALTSGKAAINAIEMHTPILFLLDIEMPMMDGYELSKKIRDNDKFKDTPILFLTSKATREYVVSAMAHGANDYILKPIEKNILLNKIERHIRVGVKR